MTFRVLAPLPLVTAGLLSLVGCKSEDDGGEGASTPTVSLGESKSGEATYYGATGAGACSFDPSPDDLDLTALNQPDWSGSSLCGACAKVTGPKGTLTVRIVDLCPECNSGDLDMGEAAFAKVAEPSAGRVAITWHLVSCAVSGPIQYRYKDGANQWWTAVQVLNHRLPVVSLEYATDGVTFQPTVRTDYNYFLTESGFGPDPVRVRVTAVDGQVLEDELPTVQERLITKGHAQFQ
jgi:expansin